MSKSSVSDFLQLLSPISSPNYGTQRGSSMLLQVLISPKQTLKIKFDCLNDFLIPGAKLAKGAHSLVLDLSLGCLVCPGAYHLYSQRDKQTVSTAHRLDLFCSTCAGP